MGSDVFNDIVGALSIGATFGAAVWISFMIHKWRR